MSLLKDYLMEEAEEKTDGDIEALIELLNDEKTEDNENE